MARGIEWLEIIEHATHEQDQRMLDYESIFV